MDLRETVTVPAPSPSVFPFLGDLAQFPRWLSIVDQVAEDDGGWFVDLRGKVGPLSRSKRLRMERVEFDPGRAVRFERRERDGREHAMWAFDARLVPIGAGTGTEVTIALHYSGALWGLVLERLLAGEVAAAKARLVALVSLGVGPG